MTVEVDLLSDFIDIIRNELGLDPSMNGNEVVIKYAWYDLRRLPQKKWKVQYSKELQQNPFFINHREYIDNIKNKAEVGEDITQHASILINNIQGKDDMLADWGIYHLHPGHGTRTARTHGFENRAAELLFVFPQKENLYFIDVLDHNSWTSFSLIEVIDKNWPSTLDQWRLKGVTGLAYEPTEDDLYKLRENQLNVSFRIGDSFFIGAGGGIATDGSSGKAVRMAINISDVLDNYSDQLKKEETKLRKLVEEKIGNQLSFENLLLSLSRFDPKTGKGDILEKNTNILFSFSLVA